MIMSRKAGEFTLIKKRYYCDLPTPTNMVGVIKSGNRIHYSTVPVMNQGEENASEKLFGAAIISNGLRNIPVVDVWVVDVELVRDTLDFTESSISSGDRGGDRSPPFVGSGTIGEDDHVSPCPVGC